MVRMPMYAAIRRDEGAASLADAIVRAGRALTIAAGEVPGFIAHAVIETSDGALVSVCICEDAAAVESVDRLLTNWLADQRGYAPARPPQLTIGEVIVQKGL